jgi:hypothetical protein
MEREREIFPFPMQEMGAKIQNGGSVSYYYQKV